MKVFLSGKYIWLVGVLLAASFITHAGATDISLSSYNADISKTSVFGVSSGAMMAMQMTHSANLRAHVLFGLANAYGSNNYMGLWNALTNSALKK